MFPSYMNKQLGKAGCKGRESLQYLQSSGLRFNKYRSGNKQKSNKNEIKAKINDIVPYLNSDNKKCFWCILMVQPKYMVTIRSILHGTVTDREFHVRVLILLYRSCEWNNFPKRECDKSITKQGLLL